MLLNAHNVKNKLNKFMLLKIQNKHGLANCHLRNAQCVFLCKD